MSCEFKVAKTSEDIASAIICKLLETLDCESFLLLS